MTTKWVETTEYVYMAIYDQLCYDKDAMVHESYTAHDSSNVLERYLTVWGTKAGESVIKYELKDYNVKKFFINRNLIKEV